MVPSSYVHAARKDDPMYVDRRTRVKQDFD